MGDAGVLGLAAADGGDAEAVEADIHAGELVLDRGAVGEVGEVGVDDLPELGVCHVQGGSDDGEDLGNRVVPQAGVQGAVQPDQQGRPTDRAIMVWKTRSGRRRRTTRDPKSRLSE
ncbi:hypothetical protein [Streptomyces sp. NPDC056194]|uniref:hypothetical protein n=1 Tax=unclassified Streptomyces TaxID=2593676 RepID=UPI0035E23C65